MIGWRTALVVPSHDAANRLQPVSSPMSQPIPSASGSHPTIAWTIRQRPWAVRSSVSARPRSAAAAPRSGAAGPAALPADACSRRAPAVGRRVALGGGGSVASAGPAVARHHDDVVCSGGGGGSGAGPDVASWSSPMVDAPWASTPAPSIAPASPARWHPGPSGGRPASARLVLGTVLARVRVLLRVDGPVGPAGGPVPAGAAPVGLELARVGPVVGRRAERGLALRSRSGHAGCAGALGRAGAVGRAARPGGPGAGARAGAAGTRRGAGAGWTGAPGPPAVGAMRRIGTGRIRRRGPGRRARDRLRRPVAGQLVVRGLDREEPRERLLAGGVGMVLLGQLAVGALDLVEAGARASGRACGTGPWLGSWLRSSRPARRLSR